VALRAISRIEAPICSAPAAAEEIPELMSPATAAAVDSPCVATTS
jgi:hypothetical protein